MKQSKVMALGTQMGSDATTLINPNFPLPSRWLLSMASSYGCGQYIKGGTEKGKDHLHNGILLLFYKQILGNT